MRAAIGGRWPSGHCPNAVFLWPSLARPKVFIAPLPRQASLELRHCHATVSVVFAPQLHSNKFGVDTYSVMKVISFPIRPQFDGPCTVRWCIALTPKLARALDALVEEEKRLTGRWNRSGTVRRLLEERITALASFNPAVASKD
jgi:hypothetical protein